MKENKLIAEFMGMQHTDIGWYDNDEVLQLQDNTFDDLEFHESWDWLMPVVEKIESTLDDDGYGNNVLIESSSCTILSGNDGSVVIGFTEGITKREATYKAVVEFINQYNKENESND